MSITVNAPASAILTDEKNVVISDGDKSDPRSIVIHPWDRAEYTTPREVYIGVGNMTDDGEAVLTEDGDSERLENIIVNRDDFVEALLAVFPELTRA